MKYPHVDGKDRTAKCPTCDAMGTVPTDFGKQVLEFVANRLVAGKDNLAIHMPTSNY